MMSFKYAVTLLLVVLACITTAFNVQTSQRVAIKSNARSLTMKGKGGKIPIMQRGEFLKQVSVKDKVRDRV
jgi:hypothetical protein